MGAVIIAGSPKTRQTSRGLSKSRRVIPPPTYPFYAQPGWQDLRKYDYSLVVIREWGWRGDGVGGGMCARGSCGWRRMIYGRPIKAGDNFQSRLGALRRVRMAGRGSLMRTHLRATMEGCELSRIRPIILSIMGRWVIQPIVGVGHIRMARAGIAANPPIRQSAICSILIVARYRISNAIRIHRGWGVSEWGGWAGEGRG